MERDSHSTKIIKASDISATTLTLKKCKLVVTSDQGPSNDYILERSTISVGSKSDNNLVIKDESVSRFHAEIVHQKDGFILRDLGSTNGTFINGVRIKEAFLTTGMTIKFGKTDVKFIPIDETIEVLPSPKFSFGDIIGQSVEMRKIFGILEKIAKTDVTVIVQGETGVGKELIAHAIHEQSARAKKPFVVFDCSAVQENLIESELFGHEKGAFTNAFNARKGAFELASGGTIFLDEIGELTMDLQPKLLRALEQRVIKRVGAESHIHVDVRVLAATNRNLEEEVKKGKFREDLYFRLAVVPIRIPSLRERKDDIPLLAKHMVDNHNKKTKDANLKIKEIKEKCLSILQSYNWPGNVRELKNAIDRAITFSQDGIITVDDLPDHFTAPASASSGVASQLSDQGMPFKAAKEKWTESFEKEYLIKLLKRNGMNISKAAKEAKIDRKSIQRLLKKYDIKIREAL